jgi:hypothetical protein
VDFTPIIDRPRRERLVHAAVDAYLNWRDECTAVSAAYRRWADADGADAELAWREYEAALGCEQRASSVYADLVQSVGEPAATDHELV